MKVVKTVSEMVSFARTPRPPQGLGLIPTMGALHAGHASLIERARSESARVVVSIFVNPTQFGPGEDFERYPRPFEADLKLCAGLGVDAVFAPERQELYPPGSRTFVEVGGLQDVLCGLSRPGHFRGVATIVAKLLAMLRPERAYFGEKDAQQLRVVQALARDLNLGVAIVPCPTVREADGLALSSRNQYLSPAERKQAPALFQALQNARRRAAAGERDALKLVAAMMERIEEEPDAGIDYVAIVDPDSLEDLTELSGPALAALAVTFGRTRLIDNLLLHPSTRTASPPQPSGTAH